MDVDAIFRLSVLIAAGVGLITFLLGGFVTPVSGHWRDGDRLVDLQQLGPWIRGQAERPGGLERYRGIASFGRVWLARRDYGPDHLKRIGFADQAIPVVDGQVTARLRFRFRGRHLEGEFIGLRFDFSDPPVRILSTAQIPATARRWERAG